MAKIRKIFGTTAPINFNSKEQDFNLYWESFKKSKLGEIYDKAYICPIIRGKETKRVEFGHKANLVQIDGINFIENLSFNAFNEGIRLISSVEMTEGLFGNKVEKLAGGNIYANNANRSYCTQNGITTSFVRKGRPSKEEENLKQTRKELGVERATKMEGAYFLNFPI